MITRDYIISLINSNKRFDGRNLLDYRDIKIEYNVSEKNAEGSARVKIGETEVVAGVKFEVGEPFPDTPDEGTIVVNVELTPLASSEFEIGPPGIDAIEIARVIDRGIRESRAIDFKSLCIKEGEKIWLIFIDIYPINDGGNLLDASYLAAIAALKNARFPALVEDKVDYKTRKENLKLNFLPIECTVYKIHNKYVIDPTHEEEKMINARLTVAIREDGKICAIQKGGKGPISDKDFDEMLKIAYEKAKELRSLLK